MQQRNHQENPSEQSIIVAMDALPISRWHKKMASIVGAATFFDGLDGVSIGYILPALTGAWHMKAAQIGWVISIGFVGQAIGSLFAGWFAEVAGRIRVLQLMTFAMGALSIACALAHTYPTLLWLRLFQGIALGGEIPIAAAYISEILPANKRGRFFLMYQLMFVAGITASSILGAWIVPRFGWQWLFLIGGIPAVLIAPIQFLCVESPRWLVSKGRVGEARAVLEKIRAEISLESRQIILPEPVAAVAVSPALPQREATSWRELFEGVYLKRTLTLWVMWSMSYMLSKNLIIWLPSLYRSVYKIPLQQSLNYGIVTTVLNLIAAFITALMIDRLGRRRLIFVCFTLTALAMVVLYLTGAGTALTVVVLANIGGFFVSAISSSLYLYTPELYPTRMRALGTSVATLWVRVTTMISPLILSYIIPRFGIVAMFLLFAICAVLGAIACLVGAVETRNQTLELIAP